MQFVIIVFLLFYAVSSCESGKKEDIDVSKIDVLVEVSRFDKEFAEATPADIPRLKKKHPYLFPQKYTDSVWESKLKDTIQLELSSEVMKKFPDFDVEQKDLELFFKYFKYYFPKQKIPKVVTVTSYVDYRNSVVLADSLLLIALDTYLGSDHKFYAGIQNYTALTLDKEFLISDVANEFVKKKVRAPDERFFLSQLIYYGKKLYLKDKLIPFKTDAQKIKYTQEQLDWVVLNEEHMWRYFVEKELLYSTSGKLAARFLDEAPFSKFQLELDVESPGRAGRYIGWQIVKAYMEKNDISLTQLLNMPSEEIFKKSNYKPRK